MHREEATSAPHLMLPPGQQLAAPGKWPLVGEREPAPWTEPWTVEICGLVERPAVLPLDALRRVAWVERGIDVHCVTRWSQPGMRFGGVPLGSVLREVGVLPTARFVSFVARSARRHSTSLALADAWRLGVLLAMEHDGRPLETEHGGPIRTVTPGRYFYKSLKWLARIELLADDRPGYWESMAGYHNRADPWQEQRFAAGTLDKQSAARLFAARDFRGQNLLSLQAAGLDLAGLRAEQALLRNADFRGVNLRGARFDGANLSNARFGGADLRDAVLRGADLEGTDFAGADLRGADLRGASLIAATFWTSGGADRRYAEALFDADTQIDRAQLDELMPAQAQWAEARLESP
jgi:DMSO/TMAO reductase YedYZ molybdopterin-dependent catalytic subunit